MLSAMAPAHPEPTPAPMPAPMLPACVSRMRIAEFKTFADLVALDILPGLTGLVGPNGCDKSNVVDALRGVSKTWGATPRAGLLGGQTVRPAPPS